MSKDDVLRVVREEFGLSESETEDQLEQAPDGRVYGIVVVTKPGALDQVPAVNSRRFWDRLRSTVGLGAANVGVIMLLNSSEA